LNALGIDKNDFFKSRKATMIDGGLPKREIDLVEVVAPK